MGVDSIIFDHASNETNACILWKNLEVRYEKKTEASKFFLIRKHVNTKFKEGGLI